MTEFLHEPFEKIIVKNLVNEDLDNFIYQRLPHSSPEVFWVDGMIISIPKLRYGAGEKEYDDMVTGIQYFEKVVFIKLPKYTLSVTWHDGVDYLRLLNYSNNAKFKELAKWIKSQPIWNTVPEKTRGDDIEIDE